MWGVWCVRHGSSVFGAGEAWAKGPDGGPLRLSEAEAKETAARLNATKGAAQVLYEARPFH